jgi:Ca2+-binding EF-hand superfamily protein
VSQEPTVLEKRLCEVFDVFDAAKIGEIGVEDLGTVVRALGNIHTKNNLDLFAYICNAFRHSLCILYSLKRMCHHRS